MKLYLRSATSISPQKTFGNSGFLTDVVEYHENRLKAIEPDYKQFIDPKLIRRMSRMIKMGVSAAKECLQQAGIEMPGAIITGTALGCQEDTVQFLTRIIEQNEELLPPTAFIQSTHNTVAAQIALMLKCHNYNSTFVHKGISFESALLDAMMLLREGETDNTLIGGTEEMTDTGFIILTRLGLYKRVPVSNLDLLASHSKGTVGGEGATFFVLSTDCHESACPVLAGLTTLYRPAGTAAIEHKIKSFLANLDLTMDDIDLVITGRNGDLRNDSVYNQLEQGILRDASLINYKHLCGEYAAASSFALWVAYQIIKTDTIPAVIKQNGNEKTSAHKILIYNHYFNIYHSLMLVSGG
jgi:3-oxoacyl-(acyl-carrier-protein) synthase